MKKAIKLAMASLIALLTLPFAFAGISVYGDYSASSGDAIVGRMGYVHIDNGANSFPDVFVCAKKDGQVVNYGMNLQSELQRSAGEKLLRKLASLSFAGFDHFGCLRARV